MSTYCFVRYFKTGLCYRACRLFFFFKWNFWLRGSFLWWTCVIIFVRILRLCCQLRTWDVIDSCAVGELVPRWVSAYPAYMKRHRSWLRPGCMPRGPHGLGLCSWQETRAPNIPPSPNYLFLSCQKSSGCGQVTLCHPEEYTTLRLLARFIISGVYLYPRGMLLFPWGLFFSPHPV